MRARLPASLMRAFARTRYEAGGATVRIGRRSPALDALLRRAGAREAAFVTAWNPFSKPMPRGWNDRMQARLRKALGARVIADGWGSGQAWAERHLLAAGPPRRIASLARRFRQHAIVAVAPGRPARIWLARAPRGVA